LGNQIVTLAIVGIGAFLLLKYVKGQGGINNVVGGIIGADSPAAPAATTTTPVATETNPPTLTAPAPTSVIQQLNSGVAIPTLDIAPQYITAMNFYAQRIAAEIHIHAVQNLSSADELQVQGVVLQYNKADLLDIAYLNGLGQTQDVGGVQSTVLTPPALQKFAHLLLMTAQRMNIPIKPDSVQLFQLYAASGNVLPTQVGQVIGAPLGPGFGVPPVAVAPGLPAGYGYY